MWILISKPLYDANKTISEQLPGASVDLSKYYWYNTDTKKILPATEIPQSGVVNGQPVDPKAKGARTDISNNAINTWFDSSKEVLYDDALSQFNISIGSDIGEFYRLASQYGISTFGYGEEGSIYKTTDEIKNKIAGDLIDKITNNAFTDKNLVEINKVQNESIDLLKFKTQGPVVTIFKGNAEKEINQSELTQYLQQGWATSKGVKTTQIEPVIEDKIIVYRDDEQKEILLSDLALFEADGWSTTEQEVVVTPTTETVTTTTPTTTTTPITPITGSGQITNTAFTEFNNVPENGLLWNVGGNFYIVYEVPGSQGEIYEGNPIYMAYELKDNDLFAAGLLTQGETAPQPNATMDQAFFDSIAIVTGNTDQLSAEIDNPFASFVETITEQSQVAPWITDPEMISLIAEAAVEGRTVTDAEWQTTNWYQTHNETEREWLRTYYSDPSTATQLTTDAQIAVANSLQAAGVSNAPEALINWVAGKYVSGEWSQTYTTEQISLFADPYATGKRDSSFENYLSSTALTGVDRTTEREKEVRELYGKWLGPTLGKLTDQEAAEIAGRLRDDPDYQDQLVQSLKQSRLAAFSAYTNPELTYEDIARPWRNLTTSVWGQTADETQGWWQEMVKSNDFAQAQNTLREKGLEQNITQVTTDATQALQQALGQGTVSQLGVNV